jgi:hypothetical protein
MTRPQAPTNRFTVTLRQPHPGAADLVISVDGASTVHALTLDQLKLFAVQVVRALAAWPEVANDAGFSATRVTPLFVPGSRAPFAFGIAAARPPRGHGRKT